MARLKTGTRIRSAVCTTEAMVIAAPDADVEITCGGVSMIDIGAEPPAGVTMSPDAAKGTALGKRYVNEAGDLELLCTKPGEGSLGAAGALLTIKEAKPLPSSD
jgi:hypothetical protein